MDKTHFNLSNLVPDFGHLLSGNFDNSEGISELFVTFMILMFLFSVLIASRAFWASRRDIKFLGGLLAGFDSSALAVKRRDLLHNAQASKKCGDLWQEFDESLVQSADCAHLFNTVDAAHFFSDITLAGSLTQNRLLAAVPAFLTAIGVLGTFVGLQLGLSNLELHQGAGVEELRNGIGSLISGASIAFLTSIWGVALSLLFNIVEKSLERSIRSKIRNLQDRIDGLFPRINAEQSLVAIADHSKTSSETLQGLAERIGDRLQEALVEATGSIRSGLEETLNQIMAPAIQTLVQNAETGSQQALESLLARFMEGLGKAGANQREMLEGASSQVNTAVSNLGEKMQDFLHQLENQQNLQRKHDQQRSESFTTQISEMHQTSTGALQETANFMQKIVDENNQLMEKRFAEQLEKDERRYQNFASGIGEYQTVQSNLISHVEALIQKQDKSHIDLYRQLTELNNELKNLVNANVKASSEIDAAAQKMNSVSNQLGLLSVNLEKAAKSLSDEINRAVESTNELAVGNRAISEGLEMALKMIDDMKKEFSQASNTLERAAQHANSGFAALDQHLANFQKALRDHVVDLEKQLSDLLKDYAEQVQTQTAHRMTEWNDHTREYTTTMKDVVNALAAAVDEIETRIGTYS